MISKISAAKVALRAGCGVFIASGAEPDILARLFAGDNPGTFFVPAGEPLESRKRWIAFYQRPAGAIAINANAVPVLREQGRSLLAIGVTGVRGRFAAGDVVNILGPDDAVLARGEVAFDDAEVRSIAGKSTDELRPLFPGRKRLEVVHRDHLVVL
jgi:glutamate 5-kinase